MTPRTLAILLLKLWGVISLVSGLTASLNSTLLFTVMLGDEEWSGRFLAMTHALRAVTQVALGAALLIAAPRLASWIDPGSEEGSGEAEPFTLEQLQMVAFGALGVFFLVGAVRDIAELVYAIIRHPVWDERGSLVAVFDARQADLAGAVVQLVASVVLLFDRAALASTWARLRPMKRPEHDADDSSGEL